jgi:ankyrin repeat protein
MVATPLRTGLLCCLLAPALTLAQQPANDTDTTRLFDAIAREDIIAVRAALATHPSFTAYDFREDTVLTAAAEQGNAAIFRLVLDAAPDINQPNKIGRTALITAVWLNQIDVLQVLLPRHPDLDHQDALGDSALFYTQSGRNDTVMLGMLLDAGANPNLVNKAGQTALSQAIGASQFEAAQMLRSHGAREVGISDAIYAAAASGDIAALRHLLDDEHADPNAHAPNGGTPLLCLAARKGNTTAVKVLLEHGADPNLLASNRQPPLYWALVSGHRSTVDALLNAHADLRAETPGHRTLLATAAYSLPDVELFELFLKAGVDINKSDIGGQTPLMGAAQTNDLSAVRFLLAHGADPTVVDSHNRSAAWYARQRNDEKVAQLLEAAAAPAHR